MKSKMLVAAAAVSVLLLGPLLSDRGYSSTGREKEIPAREADGQVDFILYKCPFFPDGYALPKDVMIKFFALRSHYTVGTVSRLVFTIHTNRDAEKVTYRLYSGIPKNPLAVAFDIEPTAVVEGALKDNSRVAFDALDTGVFPGYSQSFMLKIASENFSKGDWVSVSVDICEQKSSLEPPVCRKDAISRQISFVY